MAKCFKERDNQVQNNIIVGTVVKESPLIISIYDGSSYLEQDDILITSNLKYSQTIKEITAIDGSNENIKLTNVMIKSRDKLFDNGDKLLIACDIGNQFFYVIDILVKAGD